MKYKSGIHIVQRIRNPVSEPDQGLFAVEIAPLNKGSQANLLLTIPLI